MIELNGKFDFNLNTTYKLQNIILEENAGNFNALADKAEKLFKATDSGVVKQMISLVVRKHLLTNDVVLTGKAQHIVSKFFAKDEEKN